MSEKFQNIFKHGNEGLLVVNKQGVIETVNPRLVSMFGYNSEADLIHQKMEILIPDRLKHAHVGNRKEYSKTPENRPIGQGKQLEAQKKDGSKFFVEVSLSHFKEEGELKVIAFVIDITKRVKVEQELLNLNNELENKVEQRTNEINKQNQLLKSIAENFPNGNIYVINRNYEIEWADGQLLRNIGLNDSSLVGLSFKDRLSNDVKNTITQKLDKLFDGGTVKFEIEDKQKHFSIYGVSLIETGNKVDKALLVEMDITYEKNYEMAMKANLEKEKHLNELKSRFVAMASHEFRTPLSTIDSSALLINRYEEEKFKEKRKTHVDRIRRMVSNLTIILNDFLSLEKLETGNSKPIISEVEVHLFFKEIIENSNVFKKTNQTINCSLPKASYKIKTDANMLKNCVFNLLSNACKYSAEDGKVALDVMCTEKGLTVKVTDNGIGIPDKDKERLFTRFHRAGNVTNIEGTGLGLNIVKRYLNALGGSIAFESEINIGSTFTLELPNSLG